MHFITNRFKHFSKTNSSNPRQRVPLSLFSFQLSNALKVVANKVIFLICFGAEPTGAPQNFSGKVLSSTSVELSWEAPSIEESNGGIIRYTVRYYLEQDPGQEFINDTVDTKMTFIDLKPNTEYIFQVRAHTAVGAGPYGSSQIKNTPPPRKSVIFFFFKLKES